MLRQMNANDAIQFMLVAVLCLVKITCNKIHDVMCNHIIVHWLPDATSACETFHDPRAAMRPAMFQVHPDLSVSMVSVSSDFACELLSRFKAFGEALQRMDGFKVETKGLPWKLRQPTAPTCPHAVPTVAGQPTRGK